MACLINRNQEGKVISATVSESNLEQSKLFDSIKTNAFLESEDALNAYKSTFKQEVQDKVKDLTNPLIINSQGQLNLFYKVGNRLFKDIGDAVRFSKGQNVEGVVAVTDDIAEVEDKGLFEVSNSDIVIEGNNIKVNDSGVLETLFTIPSQKSDDFRSFLWEQIKKGKLKGTKKVIAGVEWLEAQGIEAGIIHKNAEKSYNDAVAEYGTQNVEQGGDSVSINPVSRTQVEIWDNQGNRSVVEKEELVRRLKNGEYQRLESEIQDFEQRVIPILMEDFFTKDLQEFENVKTKSDKELAGIAFSIFKKLGITTVGLSEYLEKHKLKYGDDVSVDALADMANMLVAFSEGEVTISEITEELAHFIVEGYQDQNAIREVLPEVENTEEWAELSEHYTEIYSKEYSGEALQDIVRREVLGHILKNVIQEQHKGQNQSLVSKVRTLWNNFVNKLRGNYNVSNRQKLDILTQELAQKVLSEEIVGDVTASNIFSSKKVLLNAKASRIDKAIQKSKHVLDKQYQVFAKASDRSASMLRNLIDQAKDLSDLEFINKYSGEIVEQVSNLLAKVEEADSKGTNPNFTPTEHDLLFLVKQDYKPTLIELKDALNREGGKYGETKKLTQQNIQDGIDKINRLEERTPNHVNEMVEDLVEKFLSTYSVPEKVRERAAKGISATLQKMNWFARNYLPIEHSNNIYLRLLQRIIANIHDKTQQRMLKAYKGVLSRLDEVGASNSDYQQLVEKNEKGSPTGYWFSHIRMADFENARAQNFYEAYTSAMGVTLTREEFDTLVKDKRITLSTGEVVEFVPEANMTIPQRDAFREYIDEWLIENSEQLMSSDFYRRQRKIYSDLKISPSTVNVLRSFSSRKRGILEKYKDDNGNIDMSKLSQQDIQKLNRIKGERKALKYQHDLESGIEKTEEGKRLALEIERYDRFNQLAFAQNLDEAIAKFEEDFSMSIDINLIRDNNNKLKDVFKTTLENYYANSQDNKRALDFLFGNSSIQFNANFWDSLESSNSLMNRLKEVAEESPDDVKQQVEVLESLMGRRKKILQKYQEFNNPAEITTKNMSTVAKEAIRELDDEIKVQLSKVRGLVDNSEVDFDAPVESTVNKSYIADLEASNLSEIEFIMSQLTATERGSVTLFKQKVERGDSFPISESYERFIRERFDVPNNMSIQEFLRTADINQIVIEYGKSKLPSYYRRFSPEGYTEFMEAVENGTIDALDLYNAFNGVSNELTQQYPVIDNIDLKPDFSWMEENGTDYNENYDRENPSTIQPKLSKWKNQEFYDKFGIDDSRGVNNMVATRNSRLWEIRTMLRQAQKEAFENYGETRYDLNMLPQISRGHNERWKNALQGLKGSALTEAFKDFASVRVDSMEYGAQSESGEDIKEKYGVRVVPKYYIRKLENPEDISTELGFSVGQMLEQSIRYQEKMEMVSNVNAVRDRLVQEANSANLTDTSAGITTFDNYADAYIYGINQSNRVKFILGGREFDLGKMITNLNRYNTVLNLGFNPTVALTSLTTGELFLRLETVNGEFYGKGSMKRANKMLREDTAKAVNDIGRRATKSRTMALAEVFRLDRFSDRLNNEGFSRAMRAMNNLPYRMSEIANFPIKYRVMYAIMVDNRLVDGQFMSFNTFAQRSENAELSREEIELEWKKYEGDSLADHLDVDDKGNVVFSETMQELFSDEEISNIVSAVGNKMISINSIVDSVLPEDDQFAAKRDFVMNLTTTHRNYAFITWAKRFKHQGFNFRTMQEEWGDYNRFWYMMKERSNNSKYKGLIPKSLDGAWTLLNEYSQLNPEEQRAYRKTIGDLLITSAFLVLSSLLIGYANRDDELDNWKLQYFTYIFARTNNEFNNNTPIFGLFGIRDILETPFVMMNSINNVVDSDGWSFDEIESGAYKGHSKLYRKILKQTWARQYYQLKNVDATRRYYQVLNNETLKVVELPAVSEPEED